MKTKILSVITAISIIASGICIGNYNDAYHDGYNRRYNANSTTQDETFITLANPAPEKQRLEKPALNDPEVRGDSICISWNDVSFADFYFVYRSTSKNGEFEYRGSADSTFWMDDDVSYGVRYYYKVKAFPSQSSETYRSSLKSDWRSKMLSYPTYTTYYESSDSYNYEQTVYITNTGSKYHNYGCQYLRQSCIAIDMSDAIWQGYTACSRCW